MAVDANYKLIFISGIVVYTLVTCWTDLRARKIYNWTTLPMWILGWIYQAVFFQWDGITSGVAGFAIGFGMFFILWMLKIAGGGDVKLMGALGVWLGGQLTLKVIIASLIFVACGIVILLIVRAFKHPPACKQATADCNDQAALAVAKKSARLMSFAPPVALGTWSILLLFHEQW